MILAKKFIFYGLFIPYVYFEELLIIGMFILIERFKCENNPPRM